ncbi:pantoate--beta-alanine ligase [Flavobacterium sp. N2270]|uniref:pantoate--beta-alanine ligase n=1 Tax=Flavobacterium sp. N2270 TaxID=2986831 RepID=UPI0022256DD1|nr:pantoate--beta-alanine ligase [Flavobacterium sp. N2270]
MQVFHRKSELTNFLNSQITDFKTIGFVPTMGALHSGHLSLIQNSLKNNALTVVSIFVNPTQFNNSEDLKKYPRTLEKDIEKINTLSDKIILYAPSVEDIYEKKIESTAFNFDGIENQMEGKHRPGHFDGVGTIVKKLFEIIQPTRAYFGEKDFQQLQIVKKMVSKEKLPVKIIGCEILREPNGLAMSSRNERLSKETRQNAAIIYSFLQKAKVLFKTKSAQEILNLAKKTFQTNPYFELEYFEISDEEKLLPCLRKNKSKKYRAFIAVYVEGIRLIDNISLTE